MSKKLTEEQLAKKRAARKQWREENREEYRRQQRESYERRKEQLAEKRRDPESVEHKRGYDAEYRETHAEKIAARKQKHYQANRREIIARVMENRRNKQGDDDGEIDFGTAE